MVIPSTEPWLNLRLMTYQSLKVDQTSEKKSQLTHAFLLVDQTPLLMSILSGTQNREQSRNWRKSKQTDVFTRNNQASAGCVVEAAFARMAERSNDAKNVEGKAFASTGANSFRAKFVAA